jgi:hypothetical protein
MDVEAQDDGILAKIIVCRGHRESTSMADSSASKETDRSRSRSGAG